MKSCDIGYALAANSCEGVGSVEACTVAAPDAITAFTVPNSSCSSRGSRFFRVWWPSELPRQADHPVYFGSVNVTWTNPFNRRQLDATPAKSRNASDVDHKSHLGWCKTHNFCAKNLQTGAGFVNVLAGTLPSTAEQVQDAHAKRPQNDEVCSRVGAATLSTMCRKRGSEWRAENFGSSRANTIQLQRSSVAIASHLSASENSFRAV